MRETRVNSGRKDVHYPEPLTSPVTENGSGSLRPKSYSDLFGKRGAGHHGAEKNPALRLRYDHTIDKTVVKIWLRIHRSFPVGDHGLGAGGAGVGSLGWTGPSNPAVVGGGSVAVRRTSPIVCMWLSLIVVVGGWPSLWFRFLPPTTIWGQTGLTPISKFWKIGNVPSVPELSHSAAPNASLR